VDSLARRALAGEVVGDTITMTLASSLEERLLVNDRLGYNPFKSYLKPLSWHDTAL
jgi:hypothetical protein